MANKIKRESDLKVGKNTKFLGERILVLRV